MKKKIIIVTAGILIVAGALFWYFQNKPTPSNTVNNTLESLFTTPNDNLKKYYDSLENGEQPNQSIDKIIENEFGEYFNEEGLASFIAHFCYSNSIVSLSSDIDESLKPKDINVKYDNNDFSFTLTITVKDKEYSIAGNGRLNNDKIEYLTLDNPSLKNIEEIKNIQ